MHRTARNEWRSSGAVGTSSSRRCTRRKTAGLDSLGKDRRRRIQDFALEKHFIPLQEMLASLSREGTWKGEARIRDFRTGTPIPIEIHGFAIRDEKTGQPIALAAIVRDISERKKLEEE